MLTGLFIRFFVVGLLAVGGGLSALPLMQELFVDSGWITETEFFNMLAVSQSTPGPIGINLATYIGFTTAGVAGACAATAGMVAPSLILLTWIAHSMRIWQENQTVRDVLYGIRPAAAGLIATAFAILFMRSVWPAQQGGWLPALLFILLLALRLRRPKLHPLWMILAGAICGILFL